MLHPGQFDLGPERYIRAPFRADSRVPPRTFALRDVLTGRGYW
jgi:hypothetical protein